jgi:adenine-specific DNA methylase/very-short-patch-repair endonuclease
MTHRKKLIEVALPLEAINEASAREKSNPFLQAHPRQMHLWWARRPLAAARAVIFASLVDDPDDPNALPAFVEACRKLPRGRNVDANGDTPRMRLFDFIERLVTWEATADERILSQARELIQTATAGSPPPLLDPFAGGGSIPLEAQRLGLEAHASDLNPVAVMINKAQIEIPPRFANLPPVNPRDRKTLTLGASPTGGEFGPHPPAPSPTRGEFDPHPPAPSPTRGEGELERLSVPPALEKIMIEIARKLRRESTPSEDILWQALRNRQLEGRKFRRQQPVGAFVLDFYCADERLAVEVDGPIHSQQKEADAQRQQILESLGIRFVRVTAEQVETDLPAVLAAIRAAFLSSPLIPNPSPTRGEGLNPPSPPSGRGAGGEGNPPSPQRGIGAEGEGDPPSPRQWERGLGGEGDTTYRGAAGLAADVRYYGEWMRDKAWERIGHLYPKYDPSSQTLLPQGAKGLTPPLPASERGGWGAKGLTPPLPASGRGAGGEGGKGETVIAWLWARTVKSPNPAVNAHVPLVRSFILSKRKGRECWARPVVTPAAPSSQTLLPQGEKGFTSPLPGVGEGAGVRASLPSVGEGPGDEGNPPSPQRGIGAEDEGNPPSPRQWERMPRDEGNPPSPPSGRGAGGEGSQTHTVRFEVTPGLPPKGQDGTMGRQFGGGRCIISGEPIPWDYVRAEGKAGRMGAMLMAIVTEGANGRNYYSPDEWHAQVAASAEPEWTPSGEMQGKAREVAIYGLTEFRHLFTPRQLVALTTFSDLVAEARAQAYHDALAAGLPDDGVPLREGGRGALAYAEAVSVYLGIAHSKWTDYHNTICTWNTTNENIRNLFARQAIPITWDFVEANPLGTKLSFDQSFNSISHVIESFSIDFKTFGEGRQQDASQLSQNSITVLSTDPPYYDNIGYADLSDFFYVWLRKSLRDVYPDVFGTLLVPKEPELVASPYRHGSKEAAKRHFEEGMLRTFRNIRRFAAPDYPLTVYYAFKQQEAEDPSPPRKGRGGKKGAALADESFEDDFDLPHEGRGGRKGFALADESFEDDFDLPHKGEGEGELDPGANLPSPHGGRGAGGEGNLPSSQTLLPQGEKGLSGSSLPIVDEGLQTSADHLFSLREREAWGEGNLPSSQTLLPQGEKGLSGSSLPTVDEGLQTSADHAFSLREREAWGEGNPPSSHGGRGAGGEGAKASTGWETMLASLIDAGFSIVGTWPMRTERSVRSVAIGTNALASSIVLVCRPRPADAPTISRRAFLEALRRELPAALREMQSANIAPVDLAQASIGPGIAIYSRCSKVLEADGTPMSVRTALGLINAALDAYLAEQDGDIDADTRFAVAWFEQFGFSEGEFGQADVLARAKNTSVAGVESAGVVVAGRGRVKLKHWSEYDPGAWDPQQDSRPTVWEATHYLIKQLNTKGETGSAEVMQKMPPEMAAEARQLAYRLYSICERKGWAEHARDYNALVMSWSGISEEAARLRDAAESGQATRQGRLFDDEA